MPLILVWNIRDLVLMLSSRGSNYSAWMTAKGLYRPLVNNTTISNYYYENRWTPETPDAKFPRLTSVENANNTQNSTLWMTDASFLKLRHCEVYYKFRLKLIQKQE